MAGSVPLHLLLSCLSGLQQEVQKVYCVLVQEVNAKLAAAKSVLVVGGGPSGTTGSLQLAAVFLGRM